MGKTQTAQIQLLVMGDENVCLCACVSVFVCLCLCACVFPIILLKLPFPAITVKGLFTRALQSLLVSGSLG